MTGLFTDDELPVRFTDEQLIECVERELRMRRSVYPKWVGRGTLTKGKAEREIAMMEAVRDRLRARGVE